MKFFEVIDATPMTMHIQDLDRRAVCTSAFSSAGTSSASKSTRACIAANTLLSLVSPDRSLQQADPPALERVLLRGRLECFALRGCALVMRCRSTGVPNKPRSSLREQQAKSRTV